MTKIHQEHYEVKSVNLHFVKVDEAHVGTATVRLANGSEETELKSTQDDFMQYVITLQKVVDGQGNYRLKPLKSLNQYWKDIEDLADSDGQKVRLAVQELVTGTFKFSYNPGEMFDNFLLVRTTNEDKFLPLKQDYHRIFATSLLESKQALVMRQKLVDTKPPSQKFFDGIGQIFIGLRPTDSAIQNFLFYKSFVNFDIDSLWKRLSNQTTVISDTFAEFARRRRIPGKVALPRLIDSYRRMLEATKPVLNLLRISLELRMGKPKPDKEATLGKNIAVLRLDPNYGNLFSSLDAMIRHSDAHVSIELDDSKGLVKLLDVRGKKEKLIRTYTYSNLSDMVREATQLLLPAILIGFHLQEIVMKSLVLASPEFKFRLLAVGNS